MVMNPIQDDALIIHERLLYGITRMLRREQETHPEVEQILKSCRDVVSSKTGYERLQKALMEIISRDHYRQLTKSKFLFSRLTFTSLIEGAIGRRRGKILSIEDFWPQSVRDLVYYSSVACSIGYLTLGILFQNASHLASSIQCLLNPMIFASSYMIPKWITHKRLRFRENVDVTVKASKNVNLPRKKIKIKTATSSKKFKQMLIRKGIISANIDEILTVLEVNIQGKDLSVPIKDSLPLAYLTLLNDEISEVSVTLEIIPFHEIRKHLLKIYRKRYLNDIKTDYYKIYRYRCIIVESEWDELPRNWAHKIKDAISTYNSKRRKSERRDSEDDHKRLSLKKLRCYFTDMITFYYLLIHEDYTSALLDYILLKMKLGVGTGRDLSKLFLTKDINGLIVKLEELHPELLRPLQVLIKVIPKARTILEKFQYDPQSSKPYEIMQAIECEIENNQDTYFENIVRCFYLMQLTPYIDRDVIRFANRFFYGLNIVDDEWLEQLRTWEMEGGEIYHKMQYIICTNSQNNRPEHKQKAAKLNEMICFIAHKHCTSKPSCARCYVKKFCNYASGKRMITLNEIQM